MGERGDFFNLKVSNFLSISELRWFSFFGIIIGTLLFETKYVQS